MCISNLRQTKCTYLSSTQVLGEYNHKCTLYIRCYITETLTGGDLSMMVQSPARHTSAHLHQQMHKPVNGLLDVIKAGYHHLWHRRRMGHSHKVDLLQLSDGTPHIYHENDQIQKKQAMPCFVLQCASVCFLHPVPTLHLFLIVSVSIRCFSKAFRVSSNLLPPVHLGLSRKP